ncbi:MAG: 4Fe-4S dicluster domain-containing protein [Deltaproteobacteria bacterium]|nr:4Fe-4S dicluster domain-containing protein [Deltaproteobacteria bacterium]
MKFPKMDFEGLKKESPALISSQERRNFLKMGLAITGVYAGGQILSVVSRVNEVYASTTEFLKKYPYKPHYSMVVRQGLCIDCEQCISACKETNNVPDYGYRTRILTKVVTDAIGRQREFIPTLCNHCNEPPCTRACPTKATYKNKVNGIVMMESKKCIGCKMCVLACPYEARYFNDEKRAIDKCNFCYDTRISKGEKLTACSYICPTGARIFGDISNPDNVVYKMVHQIEKQVWVLRPESGSKPNVFYMKATRSSPWELRRQADAR